LNERVWHGIPEADRKIVEDAMAEVGQRSLQWDKDSVAQYRKDLEAKGHRLRRGKGRLNIRLPQSRAGPDRQGLSGMERLSRKSRPSSMTIVRSALARGGFMAVCWHYSQSGAGHLPSPLRRWIVTPLLQIVMRGIFNVPMSGARNSRVIS
jgi:hypothetical protein